MQKKKKHRVAWVGSDFNDHLVPDLTQLAIHFPEITELTKKKKKKHFWKST